ncbi:Hypothetical protein FKW44_007725 [Caligus rogercresseyi]|uniref:Uncharacterized protein n=1 Tax=Caligus rogercresseyi TaxID=217165 RepID=A0A7T8QTT4_CALRO|nr:Hypothetical protein FKW44_007725 [Caligus rogercresseyi]
MWRLSSNINSQHSHHFYLFPLLASANGYTRLSLLLIDQIKLAKTVKMIHRELISTFSDSFPCLFTSKRWRIDLRRAVLLWRRIRNLDAHVLVLNDDILHSELKLTPQPP